jgi:hypothetical protein
MSLGLGDRVLAQQVDAEFRVGRVEVRLDFDGPSIEFDGLPVTARDHIEVSRGRIDLAVSGVVGERLLRPLAVRDIAEQVDRDLQCVYLQRCDAARLGRLQSAVQTRVALIDRTLLEIQARAQQMRRDVPWFDFERILDPGARLVVESARGDRRETDDCRHILRCEPQRLLVELDRLVVLVCLEKQIAPARAYGRIFGELL